MAAAFIGEDSQYIASGNFIDGLQSMGCPIGGPRLFKEDPGAQCFNGGTTCDGTCEIMADAEIYMFNQWRYDDTYYIWNSCT